MVQAANLFTPATGMALELITIGHPAFSDLRSASIVASTAHAYIKGYNTLRRGNATLDIKNPGLMDGQLMAYVQAIYRAFNRPGRMN